MIRTHIPALTLLAAVALANPAAAQPDPALPEMVEIRGGLFFRGSQAGPAQEKPIHAVQVSDFWMSRDEITHAQFAAFVEETGYLTEAEEFGTGRILRDGRFVYHPGFTWREPHGPGSEVAEPDRYPVVQVSWNDAVEYTRWLSRRTGMAYRLPTEAEWEYACRAGTQSRYWWGDDFEPDRLNSRATWRQGNAPWPRDEHTLITPVDRYPANPFGLRDMLGNNWEWVSDYASADHYAELVRRPESPVVDPQGPSSGHERVLRGGGWNGTPERVTCSFRFLADPPVYRSDHVGIRVVRNP